METRVGTHAIVVALLLPSAVKIQLTALVRHWVILLQVIDRNNDISVDLAGHLCEFLIQACIVRAHIQRKLAKQAFVLLEQEHIPILVVLRCLVHPGVAATIASLAFDFLLDPIVVLKWLLRDGLDHHWMVLNLIHCALILAINSTVGSQMWRFTSVRDDDLRALVVALMPC